MHPAPPPPSAPPPAPLELVLRNDLSELARLAAAVEDWTAAAGLDPEVAFHLNLVFDELLTNTISYGYDDGGEHQIAVSLGLDGGAVVARIVDDGRPFDPFRDAPAPDLDSPVEDRPIGGLGIHFAKTFMSTLRYRREDGRNVVEFTKALPGA